MFESESGVSNEVVGHLQKIVLDAVLRRHSLPGSDKPVVLPDMEFLLHQSTIIVSDENLACPTYIKESEVSFDILSQNAIENEAYKKNDVVYIRFQPPKRFDNNTVQLTLEIKIAPHDPNQRVLGLSGMSVKFQEIGSEWKIVDEPLLFAN